MHVLRALVAAAVLTCAALSASAQDKPGAKADWQATVQDRLAAYGHRNWIAIVDSAYPAQTSPGVETVVTGADQLEAVRLVLSQLSHARHVRPKIYVDAELSHVDLADAPGIDQYRADLVQLLRERDAAKLPHAEIIDKLDAAGEKFRVLVLKTNMTLPYTSVFIELDCGYWSDEAEQRLRAVMGAAAK
jgi:hypothetical protein